VCNTGEGKVVQLAFPSMDVVHTFDLFTAMDHINTLAVLDEKTIWVVLHNLGKVRYLFRLQSAYHDDICSPQLCLPLSQHGTHVLSCVAFQRGCSGFSVDMLPHNGCPKGPKASPFCAELAGASEPGNRRGGAEDTRRWHKLTWSRRLAGDVRDAQLQRDGPCNFGLGD
jgi:hypothetical protein